MRYTIPASYWDDYSDRAPVDSPEQMCAEVRRMGRRVEVECDDVQLSYLKGDAEFYASGDNVDDAPHIVRSARLALKALA